MDPGDSFVKAISVVNKMMSGLNYRLYRGLLYKKVDKGDLYMYLHSLFYLYNTARTRKIDIKQVTLKINAS